MTTLSISNNKKELKLIRAFAVIDEWFDKCDAFDSVHLDNASQSPVDVLAHTVRMNALVLTLADHRFDLHWTSEPRVRTRQMPGCFCQQTARDDERDLRAQWRNQLDHFLYYVELLHEAHTEHDVIDELITSVTENIHASLQTLRLMEARVLRQQKRNVRHGQKTLYKAVGERELEAIMETGMKHFPPRLYWQQHFYPLLRLGYAADIAEQWYRGDVDSDAAGFILAFEMPESYLRQYYIAGDRRQEELCVPAEHLHAFNASILDGIRIEKAFTGSQFRIPEIWKDLLDEVLVL